MTGQVLLRCPACGSLSYDPREPACDNSDCLYRPICPEDGNNIDPDDYDPELEGFCSPGCAADAREAAHAELSLDR